MNDKERKIILDSFCDFRQECRSNTRYNSDVDYFLSLFEIKMLSALGEIDIDEKTSNS